MMNKDEIRHKALMTAIDYHSRTYGPINLQSMPHREPEKPTAEQIIATAQKFAGFMLVETKVVPVRARK